MQVWKLDSGHLLLRQRTQPSDHFGQTSLFFSVYTESCCNRCQIAGIDYLSLNYILSSYCYVLLIGGAKAVHMRCLNLLLRWCTINFISVNLS